jgi:TolA-binding protein
MMLAMLVEVGDAASRRRRRGKAKKGPQTEADKLDFKANDMLNRGLAYLKQKQDEQGVKLITDVPRLFPKSKIRFKAWLALGNHFVDRREFERAIKNLKLVEKSEVAEEKAEALYRMGIANFYLSQYGQAFVALRKVTVEYPWSVYANEAYYYIGLCHYKLGRWGKAVEALKMVGTSVPTAESGNYIAEAGQRFYVKVFDKDLVILNLLGKDLKVQVKTSHGDSESLTLEKLDKNGEYYVSSLPSKPGKAAPNDGLLQVLAGDTVSVEYVDGNNAEGKINVKTLSKSKMVSSATVGFTDGGYKEYVKGIFAGQRAFIRVRDLDRDTGSQPDTVKVRIRTQYIPVVDEDEGGSGVDLSREEPEPEIRDEIVVTLTEQESVDPNDSSKKLGYHHSGTFVGFIEPRLREDEEGEVNREDQVLEAFSGDDIVMEYVDDLHIHSADARTLTGEAALLTGEIPEPSAAKHEARKLDHKARKALIEGKMYLRLGQIFKDVGLVKKASEKAEEGITRVESIVTMHYKGVSLDRKVVEDAFSVKWELLLVQDKLKEAMKVCGTLISLFPESSFVDKALFKIGVAKMEAKEYQEAQAIFTQITQLKSSTYKAEAMYNIGVVQEEQILEKAKKGQGGKPNLAGALNAYQRCADTFPESPFAGLSLEKVANFYIGSKSYNQALELFERIFIEHPDADFLDSMLIKWGIVLYRTKDYSGALTKFEELIENYPQSKNAAKAKKFIKVLKKKLG